MINYLTWIFLGFIGGLIPVWFRDRDRCRLAAAGLHIIAVIVLTAVAQQNGWLMQ